MTYLEILLTQTLKIKILILILETTTISKHQPVEDATPERLPQARLTMTVESSGLNFKEKIKYPQNRPHKILSIHCKFRYSPLGLPKRT